MCKAKLFCVSVFQDTNIAPSRVLDHGCDAWRDVRHGHLAEEQNRNTQIGTENLTSYVLMQLFDSRRHRGHVSFLWLHGKNEKTQRPKHTKWF